MIKILIQNKYYKDDYQCPKCQERLCSYDKVYFIEDTYICEDCAKDYIYAFSLDDIAEMIGVECKQVETALYYEIVGHLEGDG